MILIRMLMMIPMTWALLRLAWRLFGDKRVPLRLKALPVAAVLYVLSPIDLVPERFVGIGLGHIDDLIVAGALLLLFVTLAPRAVVSESLRGKQDEPPTIDGKYRYVDKD